MVKKIRIAHLTCVYPPYQGGIASVAQKYAQISMNNDYEVFIYTPNYQNNELLEEKKDNITIYRFPNKISLGNAGYINIKKYIKNIDILHIHYPFYGSLIPAILKAKKYHKKIILSWHMNPTSGGIKGIIFKLYELIITPWIFKNVDKILVSTTDYFQKHKLFQKYQFKIKKIPFSVNIDKFKIQEKNIKLLKEYELINKKVLIFVGALDQAHYFKGVGFLIKILKQLDQKYSLIIVGEGNLKENFKILTEELNIAERVIFTGKINKKDLIIHYNLADVLILPSINQGEAFGVVQIEAMACGKPVIVSNLPGVRKVLISQNELSKKQTGFIFQKNNSLDLKNKIEELFKNEKKYKEYSRNARQRVINNFSDQIISQKLINIYENLSN